MAAGFTLAELVVIIAIIGILAVTAVPSFLSYYHTAELKSGAQRVVGLVNQAREIAIKENGDVCVTMSTATHMSYRLGSCVGTAWVGAGTDALGRISLPPGITAAASANPIFNYVGSALPAAVYTLTYTQTGATLTVSVAASGRVTIP